LIIDSTNAVLILSSCRYREDSGRAATLAWSSGAPAAAGVVAGPETKVLNHERDGVPALVPEIPPATANGGARAEGGLTAGLLPLS